ncbi:alpha/beta hydrolase [Synechococcus elongatus]|uniref:Alpha/beta fold hydrolase n=1 Tax=Synechococcus elongatus PCC 11801 TaxID=2219813 RepID=A0AAN1QQL1_SYNEL|nr:alpha/beta fold hydrolase [Synechococcus elongatus]AZB73596.1 esterase [Synechococcus elongatus PCC 11801]
MTLTARHRPAIAPVAGQVVLLHGFGANAEDLLGLDAEFARPDLDLWSVEAPLPCPGTEAGRMWYDLMQTDWPGLPEAIAALQDWLQALPDQNGQPLSKTLLLGFSQGAAMTLEMGARLPVKGLMVCSGYWHPTLRWPDTQSLTAFVTHGTIDPVVPFEASEEIHRRLQAAGCQSQLLPTQSGHWIDRPAIAALRDFLNQQLPPHVTEP